MYYLISHILQGAENGIIFNGWFLHKKQSFFWGGGYSYPLSYGEVNSYTNIWFKNWIFAL